MTSKRGHLFIYGDVVGVGFRSWTVRNAESLDLTGWVRNAYKAVYPERSRRVEALFEGEEEKLKEMVERCHSGPSAAWVEKVNVKWEEATGEFEGFEIRY